MKKTMNCEPILTITGSDSVGGSGIQADIKTISSLGGYAASAITAVTVQNTVGIHEVFDLPVEIVEQQVRAVMEDLAPKVVKVGLLRNEASILAISNLLKHYQPHFVVCDPGVVSIHGDILMDRQTLAVLQRHLFPLCTVVNLKSEAAALLLNRKIENVDAMVEAAQLLVNQGCNAVLLQSSSAMGDRHTDVLVRYGSDEPTYFSSPGIIERNSHGVSGAFSTAIATFLSTGVDLQTAVLKAREYVNRLVIYSLDMKLGHGGRLLNHGGKRMVSTHLMELYNKLMSEIMLHGKENSDVAFYANKLNVSTRYLAEVTKKVVGRSPKDLIRDHLIQEIEVELKSDNKNMQEVAYKFGFSSQAQFTKFFKQMKGCPPSEFRNSNRQ